ncbi:MAG: type II toxin-antitoxin system RelE/ParE family toxin, partial [Oscillospiraceae bacterium]
MGSNPVRVTKKRKLIFQLPFFIVQKRFDEILLDPTIGSAKKGDLAGIYCYDIFYNKTNYELAYTLRYERDEIVVVLLAGTRENFYEQLKR